MASAIDSTCEQLKQMNVPLTSEENKAPYLFFLLDADVRNALELQNALKNIVNNYELKIFEELEECQKTSRVSVGKVVILIASHNHGMQLVPNIHDLQQISTIYIYSSNNKFHSQWTKNYKKVSVN